MNDKTPKGDGNMLTPPMLKHHRHLVMNDKTPKGDGNYKGLTQIFGVKTVMNDKTPKGDGNISSLEK